MKYFNILRVSKKEEIEGLDMTKHKEQAYRIMEGWHSPNNHFMQTGSKLHLINTKKFSKRVFKR